MSLFIRVLLSVRRCSSLDGVLFVRNTVKGGWPKTGCTDVKVLQHLGYFAEKGDCKATKIFGVYESSVHLWWKHRAMRV
jgi:hypothetical protein